MTFGGPAQSDNTRQVYASALAQPTVYSPPAPTVTAPGPAPPALPVPARRGRTVSSRLSGQQPQVFRRHLYKQTLLEHID